MLSAIAISVVCAAVFLVLRYRLRVRHRVFKQRLREGFSGPARSETILKGLVPQKLAGTVTI
jgi:hypothetical protein